MSDTTPGEPLPPIDDALPSQPAPYVPEPLATPAVASDQDVLADVNRPVGSAYDPMPLAVTDTQSKNWMGVVSLITGIIGISLASIILGILGLNAVKQGKATNRGMNIWGIVLGVIWIVLGIIASIAFFFFVAGAATSTAADAKVGNCYLSTIGGTGALESADPQFGECTDATNAQVFFLTEYLGALTPDDPAIGDELFTTCTTEEAIAGVNVDIASNYYVEYYLPFADSWDTMPHTVICGFSTDGGPVDPAVLTP